jgi:hypothetical protein
MHADVLAAEPEPPVADAADPAAVPLALLEFELQAAMDTATQVIHSVAAPHLRRLQSLCLHLGVLVIAGM